MARRPTDDELRELLRALPTREPPAGFAEGVMARVRAEERGRRFHPGLLAAAAVALVASGLLIRSVWNGTERAEPLAATTPAPAPVPPPEPAIAAAPADPDLREFEEIVREYRLLAEELEAIRRLGGDSVDAPMLRIGGNEDLDLFLDLESYLDRAARPPGASRVIPASTRPRR